MNTFSKIWTPKTENGSNYLRSMNAMFKLGLKEIIQKVISNIYIENGPQFYERFGIFCVIVCKQNFNQ